MGMAAEHQVPLKAIEQPLGIGVVTEQKGGVSGRGSLGVDRAEATLRTTVLVPVVAESGQNDGARE